MWLIAKWVIQIIGARIDVREGKISSILIAAEPSRPHLDPPTLTNTHPKDCCWELEMPKSKCLLKQLLAMELGRRWINTPTPSCFSWKILSAALSPQVLQRDCAPVTPTLITHFVSASFLLFPVSPFLYQVFPGVPSYISCLHPNPCHRSAPGRI